MTPSNLLPPFAGAVYVSRPMCADGHPDLPLMFAICFALAASGNKLDLFLDAIFPPYPSSLGGGDPGWMWYRELDELGNDVIVVELNDVVAPPSGAWNKYSLDKVRYEIRATLNNILFHKPIHLKEVNRVIGKFDLMHVKTLAGLMPIPDWDGELPLSLILN